MMMMVCGIRMAPYICFIKTFKGASYKSHFIQSFWLSVAFDSEEPSVGHFMLGLHNSNA